MVDISQISQMLKSLHSDTNDGHALNSHLEILQTTSSRPYFLLSKNLMVGISQISRMLKSLHSDTNDGHALNSLHGILQTTSSKLYALLRLIIGKILPFRYQRWPWTKQPSWNSTNNIFQLIFSLEQKIDSSLQGKMETQNRLSHSIQISKMAIHYYSHHEILQTTSVSKPYVLMSRNLIGWIMPKRDSEMLFSFHLDTKDGHALNSLFGIFQTSYSNPYIHLSRYLMEEASCNMETQNK